jgi:hypothetical protein
VVELLPAWLIADHHHDIMKQECGKTGALTHFPRHFHISDTVGINNLKDTGNSKVEENRKKMSFQLIFSLLISFVL